jgi:hypothetical protein
LDENIYSEDSLWDSFEAGYCDPLDYEWDPLDYECPKCHLWGEFIHDEEELIHHGFSKSSAPHGICVSCAWTGEGNIDSDSIFDLDKFSRQDGVTKASKLEYVPKSDSKKSELMLISPYYDIGANKSAKYRIKSLYRSAIKEHRYQMMSPPYFVGNRSNLFKPDYDSGKKTSEVDVERDTYISTKHDWFLSLFESFKALEQYIRNSDTGDIRPHRLPYALISTYLHKHWDFRNVEPIWVFLKRMKLGPVTFTRRLDSWITPTPTKHVTQIESLANPPTMVSINNLISIISNHAIDVRLNEDEIKAIKNQSEIIYHKLSNKIISNPGLVSEPLSFLQHLNSKAQFSDSININGTQFHASGLIEALCVNQSARMVLESRKAKNLEKKFLFPVDNVTPWWRRELTDDANKIITEFPKYLSFL